MTVTELQGYVCSYCAREMVGPVLDREERLNGNGWTRFCSALCEEKFEHTPSAMCEECGQQRTIEPPPLIDPNQVQFDEMIIPSSAWIGRGIVAVDLYPDALSDASETVWLCWEQDNDADCLSQTTRAGAYQYCDGCNRDIRWEGTDNFPMIDGDGVLCRRCAHREILDEGMQEWHIDERSARELFDRFKPQDWLSAGYILLDEFSRGEFTKNELMDRVRGERWILQDTQYGANQALYVYRPKQARWLLLMEKGA